MTFHKILVAASYTGLLVAIVFQLNRLSNSATQKTQESVVDSNGDEFVFRDIEDQYFSEKNFHKEQPKVMMLFDPTCDACEEMMERIQKHYIEFQDVHLILVTESDKEVTQKFITKFKLQDYENISVVFDRKNSLYEKFDLSEYPSFVVFDNDLNLIKVVDEYATLPILIT